MWLPEGLLPVDILGKSMAINILERKTGFEILKWDEFYSISKE